MPAHQASESTGYAQFDVEWGYESHFPTDHFRELRLEKFPFMYDDA